MAPTSPAATCVALARRRGARVVLAARKPEALDPAVAEIRAAGASSVDTVAFDATDFGTHEQFVESTFARFGDFDVVLVAFGVLGDQPRAETDAAAALEIVQTNFTGVVSVTVPLVERLEEQGHGALVLLSSVAGERARRSNFVYGSSKAGVDAFYQGPRRPPRRHRCAGPDRPARVRHDEDDRRHEARTAVDHPGGRGAGDRTRARTREHHRVGAARAPGRDVGTASPPPARLPSPRHLT